MNLSSMAVTPQSVIVTLALALLAPAQIAATTTVSLECASAAGGVVKAEVVKGNTTVTVACKSTTTVNPAANEAITNVMVGPNCDVQEALTTVCPEASGKKNSNNLSFTITKLPDTSRQFCIQCGESNDKLCTAEVYLKVPVEAGGPKVCETPGGSITLDIPASGNRAAFACAYGFHLTPTADKKVFADDCTTEKDLPKMTLAPAAYGFTVTATEKPPKKKFCYLCGPEEKKISDNASKFCSVYIQAGAGARPLFHAGLSLTLPCLLAALHFT
uniref:SRS domain-containing protein n=1 Tax=Sarcocystis aucheniae TaxID=65407 RepID=A0A5P9S457_9APIC|nr:hypothetical protein [Sarcocystis aucheniae]